MLKVVRDPTGQCKMQVQQKATKDFRCFPPYFLLNYAFLIIITLYFSVAFSSSSPLIINRRATPGYCHLHFKQTDEEPETQACYCHWGCSSHMAHCPVPPKKYGTSHLLVHAREKWGSGYGVCEFPFLLFHVYEVEMFLSQVSNLSLLNNQVTGHSWGFSGQLIVHRDNVHHHHLKSGRQ